MAQAANTVRVTRSDPVFKFDELSDSAKEKAREWFRTDYPDHDWWDGVYEDAERCAKFLGIEMGRKAQAKTPTIYFSGFWSQGDGACFEGTYNYPEFDSVERSPTQMIRGYAPKDAELHRIADELEELQAQQAVLCPGSRITAHMKHRGHYYHSGCMEVTFGIDAFGRDDFDAELDASIDQRLTQAMRDFADWIYSQLEKEHDWLTADEQVDESISANEYTFDEDGNREG